MEVTGVTLGILKAGACIGGNEDELYLGCNLMQRKHQSFHSLKLEMCTPCYGERMLQVRT